MTWGESVKRGYDGLFINGVFEQVLQEIVQVQQHLPEQILFLQPYAGEAIVQFRQNPPSVDAPVQIFVSTSAQLDQTTYTGQIVGWRDKTFLSPGEREQIVKLLETFQKGEGGLYDASNSGRPSRNLLMVRRIRKLAPAISVGSLVKVSDGRPLSSNRSRSGGWSYVNIQEGVIL